MRYLIERFLRERDSLPNRTVTPNEFRAAAKAAGWPEDETEFQLHLLTHLGSTLRVGGEMLRVEENNG
jgi:hypothetical protein